MVAENLGTMLRSLGGSLTTYLQPLTRIYLYSNLAQEISATNDIATIYIFSAIAIFVLLIACINFINLSTARTSQRIREVGLRKVMGADKIRLMVQFLTESAFFTMISCIIAVILVELSLPIFRSVSSVQLQLNYYNLLGFLPLLIIFVTMAAGGYPAFYLSGFHPILMFKKQRISNFRFRRTLVIFQFTVSIGMIICTMVIFQQITYMKNKTLGFNQEQILAVAIRNNDLRNKLPAVQQELRNFDGIIDVAASSHLPGDITYYNPYLPEGFDQTELQWMGELYVDEYFLSTLDLELILGRNFRREMSRDRDEAVIINETAMRKFGWKNPLGKTIYEITNENELESKSVIGVIRDFHIESLHKKIEPLIMMNNPGRYNIISIKINPVKLPETLDWLKKKWSEFETIRPIEYWFLDDAFNHQYRSDQTIAQIFISFTLLALAVASLGLFGLVSYTSERRSKEIGIRKVLGASVTTLISMLTFEFSRWVLISNLIAWPVAYYILEQWLQNFAYRIEVGWGPFLFSGLIVLTISLLTTMFHSVKAALGNPIEVLRQE
jgi:putative ABC transport system permease protein